MVHCFSYNNFAVIANAKDKIEENSWAIALFEGGDQRSCLARDTEVNQNIEQG